MAFDNSHDLKLSLSSPEKNSACIMIIDNDATKELLDLFCCQNKVFRNHNVRDIQ